jgi:hypothetical protein
MLCMYCVFRLLEQRNKWQRNPKLTNEASEKLRWSSIKKCNVLGQKHERELSASLTIHSTTMFRVLSFWNLRWIKLWWNIQYLTKKRLKSLKTIILLAKWQTCLKYSMITLNINDSLISTVAYNKTPMFKQKKYLKSVLTFVFQVISQ